MISSRIKPTSFAFSLFTPLMIDNLGNASLGNGQGKRCSLCSVDFQRHLTSTSLWAYLTAAMSIGTVLIFLLFGSLMEYDTMKMRSLRFFGGLVALSFLLFGFCFSPSAVYLASILAVLSKVAERVVDIAQGTPFSFQ